jgi:hypothetical protein
MSSPRYRIEHHEPHQTRVVATLSDIQPHHRGLDVFVSQLLHHGKQGWVRLVDEATGRVVAKRRIAAPARTPYRS